LNIRVNPLEGWILNASKAFPILYFENATDHGWSYHIFSNGADSASLRVSYELAYFMWLEIAELRYPGIDVHGELDHPTSQAIYDEVLASDAYQQRAQAQYKRVRVDRFAVFDFDSAVTEKLRALLTVDWYLDFERVLRQVEEFKAILNLREMDWISYRYMARDAADDIDGVE
jgi:hypothetical protein